MAPVAEQEPGNQALDLGRPADANARRRNEAVVDRTVPTAASSPIKLPLCA